MDRAELAEMMRVQADWCEKLGSPLYTVLLRRVADDVEMDGVSWRVLESHAQEPKRSLLPLRFMAATHRMALEGELPELAAFYPSAGGVADPERAWTALRHAMEQRGERIRRRIPASVQTNETGRAKALLPGFREIAKRTGLPLRLLEIGCSAGLNLRFDYLQNAHDIAIEERCGCDLNPIELDENGRLSLLSFIWPDQVKRFEDLARAIEIARKVPAEIEKGDAIEWLERQLSRPTPGLATVVYHSVVMMYFATEKRGEFTQILRKFGGKATEKAPLAWLAMETGGEEAAVELTIWPGGGTQRVATAGFHGQNVRLV